jgi:hypothetical protein
MASVTLKRIGGIARAASILVAVAAVVSVVTVVMTGLVVDDAESFLAGEIDRTEFLEAATPYALLTTLQALVLLGSAVVVIVWMHRVARNLRTLHRGTTWGPGWTIGGWFLPPFLFVIPFLVFREMWKASDPDVPVGGEWRGGSASPIITAWFVVFGPIQTALQAAQFGDMFSGFGAGEEALAEQITANMTLPLIAALSDVVAAVLFVVMVRQLTSRHRRLTGEGQT